MRYLVSRFAVVVFSLAVVGLARAQDQNLNSPFELQAPPEGGVINAFDPAANLGGEPATVSAYFTPATAEQPAILVISAQIAAGSHTYSLTQPPGGPQPTKIELAPSKDFRLLSSFRPLTPPRTHIDTENFKGLMIEEYDGLATWYAPIEISAGVNPKQLAIQGTVRMLVCSTICVSVNKDFSAKEGRLTSPDIRVAGWPLESAIGHAQSAVASFQLKDSSAKFSGRLVPSTVKPGESAELRVTAAVPPHYHIYAYDDRDKPTPIGPRPTLIALQTTSGLIPKRPTTDAPKLVDNSVPEFGSSEYHEGDVTWTQKIEVPKDAPAGEYRLEGLLGFQVCQSGPNGGTCERPQSVRFAATLRVGAERSQTDAPLTFAPGDTYAKVAAVAAPLGASYGKSADGTGASVASPPATQVQIAAPSTRSASEYDLSRVALKATGHDSISYYIALAFVGGLILNLMPCVLPVIGLKVMSFVEQSGKSRGHALMLNVWFAAGIISVFLVLGILAATIGLSWGGQFGSTSFNVTMAAVVFAMALSLLGVWEVPIPGFFGSGSVQSAAAKEGPLGAFLKGVVTTILATPCTAPLMAAAIAWAVTQPIGTNLAVFATVGLGMASPYLLIGVYPELLRFLPKPGAWMETFKQVSGFVLLGTVVFILSFLQPAAVVPTILLLLGIAVACWIVARTPLTAELGARLKSWCTAAVVLLLFIGASFGVVYRIAIAPPDTAWQPFSLERLHQVAVNEGKTVLVDFSATWCVNCKFLERTVLHTKAVQNAIASSDVVTMYGDYSDYPPEIEHTIRALGGIGVPLIAIFPGGSPYEPIVFANGYRQRDIIGAIAEAKSRQANTQVSRESQPATLTPAIVR